MPFGNPSENHDQPSPVSVLETSFEEDEHLAQLSLGNIKADRRGKFFLQIAGILLFLFNVFSDCFIQTNRGGVAFPAH